MPKNLKSNKSSILRSLTNFYQKIANFFKNRENYKLNNYKLILPILALVVVILVTSIFYYNNYKNFQKLSSNQKSSNSGKNYQNSAPNSAEIECQKQNGSYLLGQNGFECIARITNSSIISSQSSIDYFAQDFKLKQEQEKLAQTESQKINNMALSLKKVNLTKFYKPFTFDGRNMTDQTNRIIPIFEYKINPSLSLKTDNNYRYLKSIYAENEKKIYTPFWNGQIAVLDLTTGGVVWQDTTLEILDMSLFGGKYYIVSSDCKSVNGQQDCSIFEIDRKTLEKRQIYKVENKSIGATGGAGPCGNFIRQVIFVDKEFFYLDSGCFTKQIAKYRLDNGKFVVAYSMSQFPCCGPSEYTHYSFEITEQIVDFFDANYTNQQFSDGRRPLKDEKILLEGKIPKEEIETGNIENSNLKRNEEKIKKFYKPADDFWQKLFPFDVFADKLQAGKCGKFNWTLKDIYNLEVKFDGQKLDDNYKNLLCIN